MASLTGYFDVTDKWLGNSRGAWGDGTHDDTNFISDAETACENAGGGVLFFPPGTYLVSSTILIAHGKIQWRGTGPGSSQLQSAPTTSPATAPTVVKTASGLSYVTFEDMGFIGNNVTPGTSGFAQPVILIQGGSFNRVLNCYFTVNTGYCVEFTGVTDGEVSSSRFFTVGYNGKITQTTDAVFVDSTSSAIKIHHNHFDTCLYGAVNVQGYQCDVSHNCIVTPHGTGIYITGSPGTNVDGDTRIAFNSVHGATKVGSLKCSGIQAVSATNFNVIGNNVSYCDGDGISILSGWANAVVVGNNSWNNNRSGSSSVGNSGIRINSDQTAGVPSNNALVLVGNNAFDDGAGAATQAYGIRITTNTGSAGTNSVIMANNAYGNATDMSEENLFAATKAVFQDDSTAIIANSPWVERQHSTGATHTTHHNTKDPLRQGGGAMGIAGGSMRQQCGVRVTAGGTCGTNGTDSIYLSFGTTAPVTANIMTAALPTGTLGNWSLTATIMNSPNNNAAQAATCVLFLDSKLVGTYETTALIADTSVTNWVILQANAGTGNIVTNDYFILERC